VRLTAAHDRQGLSRIEVCVAVVILVILSALVLPAIISARESARRTECKNTLRQLALALQNYHDVMDSFPYGCVGNPKLPPDNRWSWYLCLGNYWGHYGTPIIEYERPWDDPALRPLQLHTWSNGPFREYDVPLTPYPLIKCPNGTKNLCFDGQPLTDYVGTAGIVPNAASLSRDSKRAGVWAYDECRSVEDIQDGTSSTLIAFETGSRNGCWIAGGPATVREYAPELPSIGDGDQFGGLHAGGAMAVYVDGHTRFFAEGTSSEVLSALLTIAGSEPVAEAFEGP